MGRHPLSLRLRRRAGVGARLVSVQWTDEDGQHRQTIELADRDEHHTGLLGSRAFVADYVCDPGRMLTEYRGVAGCSEYRRAGSRRAGPAPSLDDYDNTPEAA